MNKFATKARQALALAFVAVMASPAFAQGTGPMDEIFEAIGLAGVAALVITLGVAIIGITMSFKGIDLGKRAVGKV